MFSGLDHYIGPAAGIATAMLWTATSLLFTAAGRRIGATVVNAVRIVLAIGIHAVTHKLLVGTWWPTQASGQMVYLALSGIVGLTIGDQALFTAFVDIGPRLSILVMTTSPLFAVLLGWFVLGEVLSPAAWVGIAMTVGGVGWVVLERPRSDSGGPTPYRVRGLVLALVGAICQAGGLLLSKQGMGHGWLPDDQHMSPQAATLVRMTFAGLGMLPILALHGARAKKRAIAGIAPKHSGSKQAGLFFTACGTVVGPYLGVWMSLVATDRAPLGIAQTLCSLTPVFILPFVAIFFKERITARAAVGALIAVLGSAMLFFQSA